MFYYEQTSTHNTTNTENKNGQELNGVVWQNATFVSSKGRVCVYGYGYMAERVKEREYEHS